MRPPKPRERAVVTERFKLRNSGEVIELYDLTLDPDETVDVSADPDYAPVLAEMKAYYRGGVGTAYPGQRP